MKRMMWAWAVVLVVGSPLRGVGQETVVSHDREIKHPFGSMTPITPMVSSDRGRTWKKAELVVEPDRFYYQYSAPDAGTYWITLRVDQRGEKEGAKESSLRGVGQETIVSHNRVFKLPFVVDPAGRDRVERVTLLVSTDRGKTWKEAAQVGPEQSHFNYSAPNDGTYWFAVRVARRGEKEGKDDAPPSPTVKVRVETKDRDKPGEREDVQEQYDDARIRAELLEIEVEAAKKQIRRMTDVINETELQQVQGFSSGPVIGGNTREEREANLAKYERKLHQARDLFIVKSKELARERRRVAELERRSGRPREEPEAQTTRRRFKAAERILDEILKEMEDR